MNDKVELWAVFIWPAITGLLNIILRTRTPEEWVERCEKQPRLAAFTRFLRASLSERSAAQAKLEELQKKEEDHG
ncbi:MAG: hypothetical protein EBR82_34395 [Caulobacteraceae bacterium]|nr:hypothetical protein [Caulobacteraceae bacterium]